VIGQPTLWEIVGPNALGTGQPEPTSERGYQTFPFSLRLALAISPAGLATGSNGLARFLVLGTLFLNIRPAKCRWQGGSAEIAESSCSRAAARHRRSGGVHPQIAGVDLYLRLLVGRGP